MGKGMIISGGKDGRYQVKLLFARDRITKRIAAFNQQITLLTEQIAALASEILELESEIAFLKLEAQILTEQDREGNKNEIEKKNNELTKKIDERYAKKRRKSALELMKTSVQKKIDYLNDNMPADESVEAWCADLSRNLKGEVGTVEIPGERAIVLIQPGYSNASAYSAARDGILEPALAGTPAGTFFNWALLPGWQKWKPTYRSGYITAKDGVLCDVALIESVSSVKDLDVNTVSFLQNVPMVYMECNEVAFLVGDHVVVQFEGQSWDHPKVIGFVDHPRGCYWEPWNGPLITTDNLWVITGIEEGYTLPTDPENPKYGRLCLDFSAGSTTLITVISVEDIAIPISKKQFFIKIESSYQSTAFDSHFAFITLHGVTGKAFTMNFINVGASSGVYQNDGKTPVELEDYDLGDFIIKVEINAHANPGHTFHYEIDFINFL
ncbi:hypothetical protein SAMN04489760_1225 [Syntrophus gentianae]|uniref:Uncharacterized protein n=1 Tax=Syntrophus gentianae TaxID=43775 RepID=A0A1H7ZAX2_9BACT|nr:hypothetical protein [Syntrophus gentianae]SEM55702.1 hypothetical protein SAMN04489760_1225 [Syntrophus gentianae]